uniref:Holin n=1 Tax=viral metagenome TaxID=1070528 RepID=A0A6M3IGN1_9ZZZZ
MEILFVALAAFGGGIAAALMGWLDSGETFIGRKFMASLIRALVAGGVFAVGYTLIGGVTVMDIIIAFVAGAGVDVLGNRIAGSIRV